MPQAQSPQQRGESWGTMNVLIEGGLYLDKDVLWQASEIPGSARSLVNFEPSLDGGYHRILGYTKYDDNQMPNGNVKVDGAIANFIDSSVIAMQSGKTYRSSGSGWSLISGADTHTTPGKVSWTFYSWASNRMAWCDADPAAHPVRIESGGAYTVLSNAPTGQKFICEWQHYLWMTSGDGNLTFSAPGDDTDYNAIDGAGQINVGFPIMGLGVWRGALYVFGLNRIAQITGTSAADWQVTTLTDDIGMLASYTLQEINGDLVYLSSDGIRTISGTARVFDRELGVISRPISSLIVPMGASNWTSIPIRTKSQYRLFQSSPSTPAATAPGILGALKLQTSGSVAWEWATLSGIKPSCGSSGILNNVEVVVHGGFDGYVYQQESGQDFDGTDINALYRTPYLIFGDPNIRKILYKMCCNARASGPITLNVGITYDYASLTALQPLDQSITVTGGGTLWDGGATWDSVSPSYFYGVQPDDKACCNLIGSGFSASLSFSSIGGNDYSIQAMSIQYGMGVRR